MNRTVRLVAVLALALLLAACQSKAAATASQTTTQTQTAQGTEEMRLILGTLQLREDDLAVDAAQAAELLPLWKAYRALAQSDSTSDVERAALLEQIREAMSPEQLAAIDALTMDPSSQADLASELGLEMPIGATGEFSADEIATRMAERGVDPAAMPAGDEFRGGGPGGGFAMGGMPPEGGMPPDGAEIVGRAEQAQAGGGASVRAGAMGRNTMLLDALIKYLEEIV